MMTDFRRELGRTYSPVLLAAISAVAFICCRPSDPDEAVPRHRVLAEETIDMALKTQVEQSLLVSSALTADEIQSLLQAQYRSIMARRGYNYHDFPTNVYVYIYDEEEKATWGSYSQWWAMLKKDYGSEWEILLRERGVVRKISATHQQ